MAGAFVLLSLVIWLCIQLRPFLKSRFCLLGYAVSHCQHHVDGIYDLSKAWAIVRRNAGNQEKLVSAFLRRYAQEEVRDISAKTDENERHFVVTNFLAYADLVKEVVNAARPLAEHKKKDLVCFTTLFMPICQWFNYNAVPGVKIPRHRLVNPDWQNYIKYIRELAGTNGARSGAKNSRVLIYRCVQAVKDDVAQTLAKQGVQNPLVTESELKAHLGYWLLVPRKVTTTVEEDWAQVDPINISSVDVSGPLGKQLAELYPKNVTAYIIIPPEQEEQQIPEHPPGYLWVRVGDAFINLFHPTPAAEHCFYRVFTTVNDYKGTYVNPPRGSPIPQDFFMLGMAQRDGFREQIEWIFALGGTVDSKTRMIELEIATADLNKDRFDRIEDVAKTLMPLRSSHKLQDLVPK